MLLNKHMAAGTEKNIYGCSLKGEITLVPTSSTLAPSAIRVKRKPAINTNWGRVIFPLLACKFFPSDELTFLELNHLNQPNLV